jgi:hypothetical protein
MAGRKPSWLFEHLALLMPASMKEKREPEGLIAAFEETRLACENVYANYEAKNGDVDSMLMSFASVQVAAEKGMAIAGAELGLEPEAAKEYAYRMLAVSKEGRGAI